MNRARFARRVDGETELARARIEEFTGVYYDRCPWRALEDPFVRQVRAAYRYWETGQLAVYLRGRVATRGLVEAVGLYHSLVMRSLDGHRERDRLKRKAEERDDD